MSKEAIEHYEAALKEAFPSGATGNVFHHWNEARKALAEQSQQEPVRCPQAIIDAITAYGDARADQDANNAPTTSHERLADCIRLMRKALAEQPAQQEPPTVAELVCVCGAEWEWRNRDWELVATPPAQRTWVGLTEQQVFEFIEVNTEWKPAAGLWRLNEVEFARDIEAKLKEKNQ